jgi:hypothetical protein
VRLSLVVAFVSAAVFVLGSAFFAPALATPAAAQPPACEWTGHPTLTSLRVESPSPGRISIVPLAGRRATVSLIAIDLFLVRTLDDAAPVAGTTRERIAIAVSGVQTFSGVATVASGALVEELTPRRAGLRGNIAIADGVHLERVTLPCAQLGLASDVSALPIVGPPAPGPRWHTRARLLRMRARPEVDAPRLGVSIVDRARHAFIERDRRDGWVRVEALFPGASLSGWVPDSDLARTP